MYAAVGSSSCSCESKRLRCRSELVRRAQKQGAMDAESQRAFGKADDMCAPHLTLRSHPKRLEDSSTN